MRYGDSQLYSPAREDQGMLEFRMEKTRGKAIAPLFEPTKEILVKWGGYPPKISGQKFNIYLKVLFSDLKLDRMVTVMEKVIDGSQRGYRHIEGHRKLCDVITTHVARKTFITTALIKGMAIQDVMKMSGHSDFRAMRPYIAISKKHLRKASMLWNL